jgi:hypothetical protein
LFETHNLLYIYYYNHKECLAFKLKQRISCICLPVSLSKARYQVCPSSEVVKWFSDHIILKLSVNDPLESAASHTKPEAAMRAAMKRRVAIAETLLFIFGWVDFVGRGGGLSAGSLRRRCVLNDLYLKTDFSHLDWNSDLYWLADQLFSCYICTFLPM